MRTADWLLLAAVIVIPLTLLVRGVRRENRKTAAFIASLDRMGRRCPACQPWGGYVLGRMRPDGSYETRTCDLCGGTGELP